MPINPTSNSPFFQNSLLQNTLAGGNNLLSNKGLIGLNKNAKPGTLFTFSGLNKYKNNSLLSSQQSFGFKTNPFMSMSSGTYSFLTSLVQSLSSSFYSLYNQNSQSPFNYVSYRGSVSLYNTGPLFGGQGTQTGQGTGTSGWIQININFNVGNTGTGTTTGGGATSGTGTGTTTGGTGTGTTTGGTGGVGAASGTGTTTGGTGTGTGTGTGGVGAASGTGTTTGGTGTGTGTGGTGGVGAASGTGTTTGGTGTGGTGGVGAASGTGTTTGGTGTGTGTGGTGGVGAASGTGTTTGGTGTGTTTGGTGGVGAASGTGTTTGGTGTGTGTGGTGGVGAASGTGTTTGGTGTGGTGGVGAASGTGTTTGGTGTGGTGGTGGVGAASGTGTTTGGTGTGSTGGTGGVGATSGTGTGVSGTSGWVTVGNPLAVNTAVNPENATVITDNQGNQIVAWLHTTSSPAEPQNIRVKQWNGTDWVDMGTGSSSTLGVTGYTDKSICAAGEQRLTKDNDGNIFLTYAAHSFQDNTDMLYVKKWNGSEWEDVGGGGPVVNDREIYTYGFNIEHSDNGKTYLSYAKDEFNSNNWKAKTLHVLEWNGNSWAELKSSQTPSGSLNSADENMTRADGSSMTIDNSGNVVVAWTGRNAITRDVEIRSARWNGSDWEEFAAPTNSVTGSMPNEPQLTKDSGGNIYLSWQESGATSELYTRRLQGNEWKEFETNTPIPYSSQYNRPTIKREGVYEAGGNIYRASIETDYSNLSSTGVLNKNILVEKLEGDEWKLVGKDRASDVNNPLGRTTADDSISLSEDSSGNPMFVYFSKPYASQSWSGELLIRKFIP